MLTEAGVPAGLLRAVPGFIKTRASGTCRPTMSRVCGTGRADSREQWRPPLIVPNRSRARSERAPRPNPASWSCRYRTG